MRFKRLTADNFDERDKTNDAFAKVNLATGQVVPVSGRDRARAFLAVELGPRVPEHVRDLFAVARGTMLYGEFFYPLFTLGDEQMHRVVDAAAHHRYLHLGGETKRGRVPPFRRRIEWLMERGAIPEDEWQRWNAYRELRNIASHPDFQQLHTPPDALVTCRLVPASVDALFQSPVLKRPQTRVIGRPARRERRTSPRATAAPSATGSPEAAARDQDGAHRAPIINAVNPATRRAVAYIAGRLGSGASASSVYDFSESRHVSINGEVSSGNVNVYDYDERCHISGTPDSLYHYGNSAHLQLRMNGREFNGYDFASCSHFSGSVNGSSVSLYDFGESTHFNYSL